MVSLDSTGCPSGSVAIVGRPNTGKSTLLNRLLARKCSITSSHPQTTRCRASAVKSGHAADIVYVDTPGTQPRRGDLLSRCMHKELLTALDEAGLILFLVEALRWKAGDQHTVELLRWSEKKVPILLVVNKVDRVPRKELLLPYIQQAAGHFEFSQVIPLAARTGLNVDRLEYCVDQYLQQGPLSSVELRRSVFNQQRFWAAELLREKLLRRLRDELPYCVAVEVERFYRRASAVHIHASIWVESEGQKRIVIGKGGEMLKTVGQQARIELERALGRKVNLKTWVKVEKNWSDNGQAMALLGYG